MATNRPTTTLSATASPASPHYVWEGTEVSASFRNLVIVKHCLNVGPDEAAISSWIVANADRIEVDHLGNIVALDGLRVGGDTVFHLIDPADGLRVPSPNPFTLWCCQTGRVTDADGRNYRRAFWTIDPDLPRDGDNYHTVAG